MSGSLVISGVENRSLVFTAAELGFTTSLIGSGTLVTLIDRLPEGWSVRAVQVRREGTITNAGGTTVLDIGVTGAESGIVNDLDLEGSGVAWLAPTVVRYDSVAPIAVVARVITATAAASPVAGVTVGLDIVKYREE